MSAVRPPAFTVAGLTKQYELVAALHGVSFTVPAGSIAALVGPVGAGKTTIARILLGLLTPSSGSVEIKGPGAAPRSPQLINGVLSPRGLHPGRTVRGHLRVYAAAAGVSNDRVTELLESTGLTELAGTPTGELSPGQQTRLALTTALLGDPPLLVLDDVFAGADAAERGWLQDTLRRHSRRGGTVLLSSDSLAAVLSIADNVIVVSEGAVVYQGTPTKLRRSHPDRIVVAGSPLIALATMLAARGYTDAVIRPDGRLAIAEATEQQIRDAAIAAQVRIDHVSADPIHPDRVLASLTKPARPAFVPYPGVAVNHPSPMPYGIPR